MAITGIVITAGTTGAGAPIGAASEAAAIPALIATLGSTSTATTAIGIAVAGGGVGVLIENLLTGVNHDLKNRYMHVDYTKKFPKCKNCTLEELAILKDISNNPSITQKALADAIGRSERTVKSRTVEL